MVVPMIAGGELIGALGFVGAPGPFPSEQVRISFSMLFIALIGRPSSPGLASASPRCTASFTARVVASGEKALSAGGHVLFYFG
jgi:hypothetical protein